jgi:large subunit ribosomal protein L13
MTTYIPKSGDLRPDWWVVDARGMSLGRLASQVAARLRGKHKPSFTPFLDTGDHVVVVNAAKVVLTGNKLKDKIYRRHSGYPGGLREVRAEDLLERHPERLVELAVRGMLPKGPLGRRMFRKLKVCAAADHAHQAQRPRRLELRGIKPSRGGRREDRR